MIKKAIILLFAIGAPMLVLSQSQFLPFKGFHLGVTYQGELAQKCKISQLAGNDYNYPPKARHTFGWETGIELSYHFAKYFGISIGLNLGTEAAWRYDYYHDDHQYEDGGFENAGYENFYRIFRFNDFVLPLKVEVHFPLCRHLMLMADVGIKIKGIMKAITLERGVEEYITHVASYDKFDSTQQFYIDDEFFQVFQTHPLARVDVDFLIGAGLYYQLPYGDLLRCTAGANIAFRDFSSGYWQYPKHNALGSISIRHTFFYMQLAYVHTFNYEKAKRWVKIRRLDFESKKDKRRYLLELLKFTP